MDFESLAAGRIIPPWTPTVVGSMDTSQFDMEFTSMLPVGKKQRSKRKVKRIQEGTEWKGRERKGMGREGK